MLYLAIINNKLNVMLILICIENWNNLTRRHSGLGYLSPSNFEKKHNEKNQTVINPFLQNEALSV